LLQPLLDEAADGLGTPWDVGLLAAPLIKTPKELVAEPDLERSIKDGAFRSPHPFLSLGHFLY
jgi:hypothetical protein